MAYKLTKQFPQNFGEDVISVVDALTLKHGDSPFLYGSSRYKLNYPSDYDLGQLVPESKFIQRDIKEVVKKLLKEKNVYIGDIKSGEVPELMVVPHDLNETNYNKYRPLMIKKLKQLCDNKNITAEEYKESIALLKPDLKELDIYVIKHDIRYEVIRWKAEDILKGFVNYRNMKIDFNKYLIGDSMTKIDAIAWVNGIRYCEITMYYIFTKNNKVINTNFGDLRLSVIKEIPYLLHVEKYMKICKRINSIEMDSENPKTDLLEKFNWLFNSDLGLINQVISDIASLEFLIENVKSIPKEKVEFEINQINYRLSNVSNVKYLKQEGTVLKLIDAIEKDVLDLKLIEQLKDTLTNILKTETLNIMKKWGLFPIPLEYLPIEMREDKTPNLYTQFLYGGKLKVKHLREILNASYSKTPPKEIDDFILDKELSNTYAKIYHNPKTNQTVIAHKGTQGVLDWGNNLIYGLFGKTGYKLTGRYKNAENIQKATEAKYGTKDLTTAGHSQGALNAEILGQKGKEVITLNKATRPFANKKGEKQHDISTTGDVISKLNPFQKKSKKDISIKSKSYNPIKEHILPVLDGLDEDTEIGEGNKKVCMKKGALIKEHKELIPILEHGSKKQRMKEGLKQEKELNKYL